MYDNGYNPSDILSLMSVIRLWALLDAVQFLVSRPSLPFPPRRRRRDLSPRSLGFTTFPFFISTIKLAVRGETMASSAWAFLRGEKKAYRLSTDREGLGRCVCPLVRFSRTQTKREREREPVLQADLSRIAMNRDRFCWLRIRNCFLLGEGGQVKWLTTNFLRQASHSPVWSIRLSPGVPVFVIPSRVHHGSLVRLRKSLVTARERIPSPKKKCPLILQDFMELCSINRNQLEDLVRIKA